MTDMEQKPKQGGETRVAVVRQKVVKVAAPTESQSVETFISQAIAANASVETMEKLFALMVNVKAEKAKEAFVRAMGKFQNDCPVIQKKRKVLSKDGSVRYQFAPLEDIVSQIKKPVMDNELSYSWNTEHTDKHMKVTCTITHVLGHSATSTFEIPIDTEGYMTAPQKYASAQTFAKRYTLCNALGISTGDEDDDATTVGKEPAPKSDKAKILFLLRTLGLKHGTKEQSEESVKKATGLDLVDANLGEIVNRLEVIVAEQNESKDIQ